MIKKENSSMKDIIASESQNTNEGCIINNAGNDNIFTITNFSSAQIVALIKAIEQLTISINKLQESLNKD